MKNPIHRIIAILLLLGVHMPHHAGAQAQYITSLIVEITTGDVRFAGTDDNMVLQIGGKTFTLDDPDRDDFERDNTDHFEFVIEDDRFGFEMIRGVGTIAITKTEDSFFGGGWRFGGITVWADAMSTDPIYQNDHVDRWLDGDDLSDRQWITTLGEEGWNLPAEQLFPPCQEGPIILFADPDTSTLDSDCDGIPDASDPTFDTPPDADGDGLPDLYEEQNGSSTTNPDSDGDGWQDGHNRRSFLVLTHIECRDEDEDIGHDELYLVAEDVRFPEEAPLHGYWEMNDDTSVSPFIILESRATPPATTPAFKSRMRLRESDFEFFKKPTDDTLQSFEVNWGESGETSITLNQGDFEYILTFRWFSTNFVDPTAIDETGDLEPDGLTEELEARISTQDATLRPAGQERIEGYDGLADPAFHELFVEVDASGADYGMPFEAKQLVSSRFHYQNIATRFDDGYLGNENDGIVPYQEIIPFSQLGTFRTNNMWAERRTHYRYLLFVDKMEDETLGMGHNGRADRPGTKFMVSRTSMLGLFSAIVTIHEMGHTLGLCHPIGTKEPPSPSPTCPTPSDWVADDQHCVHYCGVGEDDITAMGDDIDLFNKGIIGGAAIGAGAGVVIGGLIGGPVGAIVGGIVGGIIGGAIGSILGSDAYAREVDYNVHEWAALNFKVFP